MFKSALHFLDGFDSFSKGLLLSFTATVIAYLTSQSPFALGIFPAYVISYLAINNINWVFYLLLFLLPISINLDVTPSLTLDFPDEPLMWLLTLLVFLLILSKPKVLDKNFFNTPPIRIISLLYFWMFISAAMSTDILPSLKYILAKTWYIFPFLILSFLVFRSYKNMRTSFIAYMTSFTVFLAYTLYLQKLNNFNFEKVNQAVMPFFHNHVNYSAVLSILLPFMVFAFFMTKEMWKKLVIAAITIVILFALYFAYGRGAWVATIAAIAMYFFMRLRISRLVVFIGFLAVGYSIYWLSVDNRYLNYRPKFEKTIMHDNLADHMIATFKGTDVSSMERVHRWIASVRMVEDHPFFGVGPNNYYENYRYYTVQSFRTWVSRNLERSTSHNYFLLMLTEQGIVAMLLYALLVYFSLSYAQKIYNKSKDKRIRWLSLAVGSALTAFYVNNFLSELIETDEVGSLFYMCIALLVVMDFHNRGRINIFSS